MKRYYSEQKMNYATKERTCSSCGMNISKGDPYVRFTITSSLDGYGVFAMCCGCREAVRWLPPLVNRTDPTGPPERLVLKQE